METAAVRTRMLVRARVEEVFQAFVDPAMTTRFWFSASSGHLAPGAVVRWEWEMYGVGTTVRVLDIETDRRILIEWDEPPHPVEWTFLPWGSSATLVEIRAWGFGSSSSEDDRHALALDLMNGFSLVLAGLKAFLEHGVELGLVADRAPEAITDARWLARLPAVGDSDARAAPLPGRPTTPAAEPAVGDQPELDGPERQSSIHGAEATGAGWPPTTEAPEVRRIEQEDLREWVELRSRLWPDEPPTELAAEGRDALGMDPPLIVFVASTGRALVGFVELGLRSYAEGCATSPVPYIEGWYVLPEWRGRGVGAALIAASEQWAREKGYPEMGSDALVDNVPSHAAHRALGFQEVETITVFRKSLSERTVGASDPATPS